jgi:hypothetical protein
MASKGVAPKKRILSINVGIIPPAILRACQPFTVSLFLKGQHSVGLCCVFYSSFADTFFAKERAPKKWEQIEKRLLLRVCDFIEKTVPFKGSSSLTENNERAPYKWSWDGLKNWHLSKEWTPYKWSLSIL